MDRPGLGITTARVRGRARLFELVGVVLALDERAGLDERERRRLDRKIGAGAGAGTSVSTTSRRSLSLLRAWLRLAPSESLRARIEGLRAAIFALGWILTAIGFFMGWATASALLSIQIRDGRINIVLVVMLLVVVPFCLLVVSLLGWLWSMRRFGAGGTRSMTERLRSLGLGRLALYLLPHSVRQDAEVVIGRFTAHGRLYGRVERRQLFLWSQRMALGFALGALLATLSFVVFTDLAFGWSTTLEVSAGEVHRWVRVLALPWASIWPAASPSLELVEATRFFRVARADVTGAIDPIIYGGWWPFLVMSIVGYAIVPRALMLGVAAAGLARETGNAIGLTPGVDRLLDRLTIPIVEAQASLEEGPIGEPLDDLVPEVELKPWVAAHAGRAPVVVRWAQSADGAALQSALGAAEMQLLDAGGKCSLDEDAEVARALAGRLAGEYAGIVFCVRGYEPPVLDVLDFLGAIRDQIGRERPLLVALVGASDSNVATWRRKLIGRGDPRLVVAAAEVEAEVADA